jgi:hypothetical protein
MLKIKINKWRDYLIRADLHVVTWIRVPVVLPITRALHGLVSETRWLLVYFLCEAGRENGNGELNIELDYVVAFSGCSTKQIFDGIKSLQDRGFLTVEYEGNTEETRLQHERNTTPCTDDTTPCSENTETHGFVSKRREEKRREEKKTKREEESPRETNLDAGDAGSSRSGKSGSRKSRSKAVQVMDLSDAELDLGTQWLKFAVTHLPNRETDSKWTPDQFALELRKVANVANLTIADMHTILAFVKGDTFWARNATSPFGLLKKGGNGLRKVENIFAQTKSKAQIKNDALAAKWEEDPEEKKAYEDGMAQVREAIKRQRSMQR